MGRGLILGEDSPLTLQYGENIRFVRTLRIIQQLINCDFLERVMMRTTQEGKLFSHSRSLFLILREP